MSEKKKYDSIMFDMDGTLWDAVDSYCAVWNKTIADLGIDHAPVTRQELLSNMGKLLGDIIDTLVPECSGESRFTEGLAASEVEMMPRLGGRLYPGVADTVSQLSKTHKLFMVSNCGRRGLPNFLRFTGLEPYFTGHLAYGDTGKGKDVNIKLVKERYNLSSPLYVGDIRADMEAAHSAGVPFAWASYGFGKDVAGAEYTLRSITDLPGLIS